MSFQKGHKINLGRKWSEQRNLKISKALNKKMSKSCQTCGGIFQVCLCRAESAKYCSRRCLFQRNGNGERHYNKCLVCKKEYWVKASRYKKSGTRFCSAQCHAKFLKGKINEKLQEGRKRVIGKNHPMFGKHPVAWNKGKQNPQMSGDKSPSWRGGITPINEKIRKSKEYILWRVAIFTRDDYTCQKCGVRGRKMNADHIKPFALYPELRFAIDNGETLCEPCHRKKTSFDMIFMRKEIPIWMKN